MGVYIVLTMYKGFGALREMSISSIVLDKISKLTEDVEARNGRIIVLNDPALLFYGLPKPFEEVRILVSGNIDEIVYHVAENLGLKPYINDITKSINVAGIAVLNPIALPITIIEKPRSEIDRDIVENNRRIEIDNYRFNIPYLEDLITKLLHLGSYPYTAYAYTLLIVNASEIDWEKLYGKLRLNHINIGKIRENIAKIIGVLNIFPELTNTIEAARKAINETL